MFFSVRKWLSLAFFVLAVSYAHAQVISNMSFEGAPRQDYPPDGWSPCNSYSTPDTQPGFWEVQKAPSDGDTYLGLVTRGDLGPYAHTTEAVETRLLKPLLKGSTYQLRLDLAFSEKWGHYIGWGSEFLKYDTPAKLVIYGGSTSCEKLETLWESPVIDHTEWKTYSMTLAPQVKDVSYLLLEAAYEGNSTYYGNILLDNFGECFIELELASQYDICEDEPLVLDVTIPNGDYLWQDGSTNPDYTITTTGSYSVTVSNRCISETYEFSVDARNCKCDEAVPIKVSDFDSLICKNESIVLDVTTPGGSYLWENGDEEPLRSINSAGKYSVEVFNGCETVYLEYNIGVSECTCEIAAPNVFTPNGDQTNETFEINGSQNLARYNLRIYNRWGTILYQSDDISKVWDGTLNGEEVPSGVYFWTIEVSCIQGISIVDNSFKGNVTVLR